MLDPACGSGNFLYLGLRALKDIEHRVNVEAEALGLPRAFPAVGPEAVLGIELNPYAAELARVSVWIGEIQWMRANGYQAGRNPILRPLDTIECRDAILNEDGTETEWPEANAIIGNPPFLGAKLMKGSLGVTETERIRKAFRGACPASLISSATGSRRREIRSFTEAPNGPALLRRTPSPRTRTCPSCGG